MRVENVVGFGGLLVWVQVRMRGLMVGIREGS